MIFSLGGIDKINLSDTSSNLRLSLKHQLLVINARKLTSRSGLDKVVTVMGCLHTAFSPTTAVLKFKSCRFRFRKSLSSTVTYS